MIKVVGLTKYNYLIDQLQEYGDDCIRWPFSKNGKGYGQLGVNGTIKGAHCVAYEYIHGPIPHGLEIDHLCCVHDCFNPNHLEAVTRGVNARRGLTGHLELSRTHCPQGHEYTTANTTVRRGARGCKTCHRDQERARYWRSKQ